VVEIFPVTGPLCSFKCNLPSLDIGVLQSSRDTGHPAWGLASPCNTSLVGSE